MNIALVGYGNMGQEIQKLVDQAKQHTIVSISFKTNADVLDQKGIKKADVVIDFTSPEIVLDNIQKVAELGKPMVVGTTGWYQQLAEVEKIVVKNKIGLIYGGNFSIGANIYFKILEKAAQLFNKYESYDVYGYELHHTGKKDSPSGTAKKIGDIIIKNFTQKKKLQNESLQRQVEKDELHFASIRGGRNPGHHSVFFDSVADEIELSHQAHGRAGFAEGAIRAAEFIVNKKGIYEFSDVFEKI